MSSTTSAEHRESRRAARRTTTRAVSVVTAAALGTAAFGAVALLGAGPASAATLQAQSVGRFVDGSLGGNPIQQVVDLKDARATAPGSQSTQNPLDATVLGSLHVPLTGALQLPGPGSTSTGVANQVAVAKTDGYSYGASGAVLNSGGVSLGGSNGSSPADASLTLDASALSSLLGSSAPTLPVPGAANLDALGSVKLDIGAVAALAQTQTGGAAVRPHYGIAGLRLTLTSPALAALLGQLSSGSTTLTGLLKLLPSGAPDSCALTSGTVPTSIPLDNGAVVVDASTGSIVVDLGALLHTLGLDLNDLPANTDLLGYLVAKLPSVLTAGLEGVVNGISQPLAKLGKDCIPALSTVIDALTSGQATLETTINQLAGTLSSTGSTGLGALTDGLSKVLAIGANVESGPGAGPSNTRHPYTSALRATPDQSTPVVDGQTLVRALELQVGGSSGAVVALASAAAGPGTASPGSTPSSSPSQLPANSAVPNAIPAGKGPIDHPSSLPLVLLVVGLVIGAAGIGTWRWRLRQGA